MIIFIISFPPTLIYILHINLATTGALSAAARLLGDRYIYCRFGSKVVRVNPETGESVFEILLPVPKITPCAFGGPRLDKLYITSESYLMNTEQLAKYPLSGSLFITDVPFRGTLPNKMKG